MAAFYVLAAIALPKIVKAESIFDRLSDFFKGVSGFEYASDSQSRFIFTKETPNYIAYAGERTDNGSHKIRIEKDGFYLEFSLLTASRNYNEASKSSGIKETESKPETTDISGAEVLGILSKEQKAIMDKIEAQMKVIDEGLSSISGEIAGLQTELSDISEEIRDVTSKAKLVEEKNARVIKFENILPQTDFVYRLNEGGIKEEILINEKPLNGAPNIYVFSLKTENMDFRDLGKGVWYFYDKNGEAIFRIPKGWAKDSNNAINNEVDINLEQKSDYIEVTITVPADWLTSVDRLYPIIIDPTVELVPEKRFTQGTAVTPTETAIKDSPSPGTSINTTPSKPSLTPEPLITTTVPAVSPKAAESQPAATSAPVSATPPASTVAPIIETPPDDTATKGAVPE